MIFDYRLWVLKALGVSVGMVGFASGFYCYCYKPTK